MPHSDRVCRAVFRRKMAVFRRRGPPDGNQMIPVTETSTLGRRRNGTTLCRACKIAPARSRFDRLSVKSGRFVRSGRDVSCDV